MSLSNIENRTNSLNGQVQSYIISRNEILYTDNIYANNVSSRNDLNLNFAQAYQSKLNDVNVNVLGGINTATEIHSNIESSEFQNTIMHKVQLSDIVLDNPKFDNLSLNGANIKQINDASLHDITIRNSNLNIETDVNLNSLAGNNFFINNSFIENVNAKSFGKLENANIGTVTFNPNITANINSANVENMFVIHNLIAEDFESNSFNVSSNLIIENLISQNVNLNMQDGVIFTRFDGKLMTDKSAALGSNFDEMVNGAFAYNYFNNLSLSWNPDSTIKKINNLPLPTLNTNNIIADIGNNYNNTINQINNDYSNQLDNLNSYINNKVVEANNVIDIGKQEASNIISDMENKFSEPPASPVYDNLNNTCEISLKNMVNYPVTHLYQKYASIDENQDIDFSFPSFDYFDIAYRHNTPNGNYTLMNNFPIINIDNNNQIIPNTYFQIWRGDGELQGRRFNTGNLLVLSIDGYVINGWGTEIFKYIFERSTLKEAYNYIWLNYGPYFGFELKSSSYQLPINFRANITMGRASCSRCSMPSINIGGVFLKRLSDRMFEMCTNLKTALLIVNEIEDWLNEVYISNMFNGCTNLSTVNITFPNSNKVFDTSNMFNNCVNLSRLSVNGINGMSNICNASNMFLNCKKISQSIQINAAQNYNNINFSNCFRDASTAAFIPSIQIVNSNNVNMSNCFNNFNDGYVDGQINVNVSASNLNMSNCFASTDIFHTTTSIDALNSDINLTALCAGANASLISLNVLNFGNLSNTEAFQGMLLATNARYNIVCNFTYTGALNHSPNLENQLSWVMGARNLDFRFYGNCNLSNLAHNLTRVNNLNVITNTSNYLGIRNIVCNSIFHTLKLELLTNNYQDKFNNIAQNTQANTFYLRVNRFNWTNSDSMSSLKIGVQNSTNIILESGKTEVHYICNPFDRLNPSATMSAFNINVISEIRDLVELNNKVTVNNVIIKCTQLYSCIALRSNDSRIQNFNFTGNLVKGTGMLYNCRNLRNVRLNLQYTGSTTDSQWQYSQAFGNCYNLLNFNIYYNANWTQFNNWRNTFNSQIQLPNKNVINYIPY